MRLAELAGRRVVLLGLGADVTASLEAIADAGPAELVAVEEGEPGSPGADVQRLQLPDAVGSAEIFVRSPGFPRYHPLLVEARERGARMTTPLDLWMGTCGPDRTVVAITGTKGKSTVTDLVGRLADRAGLDAGVAGNLGVPVFSSDWNHEAPLIVLEVSSYQAADLHHVPDVAVLTYLSEDHLSWHGGRERYVSDKLRVLRNEGGTAHRILLPVDGGAAGEAVAALLRRAEPGEGATDSSLPESTVETVTPQATTEPVPHHRLQNAALAARVVDLMGGGRPDDRAVVEAARASLPGRLDECPGPDGVLCLDDALASNPSAVAAGLAWLRTLGRPTIVILGGTDRGVDARPLVEEAARWEPGMLRAIVLPENGRILAGRAGLPVLAEASDVGAATRAAMAGSNAGGVILFAPGAPTPSHIGTWQTRSSQFRNAVGSPVR